MNQKKRYEEIMELIMRDDNLHDRVDIIDSDNQLAVASMIGGAVVRVETRSGITLPDNRIKYLMPHIIDGIIMKNNFIAAVVDEYRDLAIPAFMGINKDQIDDSDPNAPSVLTKIKRKLRFIVSC